MAEGRGRAEARERPPRTPHHSPTQHRKKSGNICAHMPISTLPAAGGCVLREHRVVHARALREREREGEGHMLGEVGRRPILGRAYESLRGKMPSEMLVGYARGNGK